MKTLVLVLDLAGTFVFALSGAMAAVRNRLDLFGILVVSFAAATFGGMGRDLLIGAVPPAAIADWRYVATSALAGLVIFLLDAQEVRHTSANLRCCRTRVLCCFRLVESLPIRRSTCRRGPARRAHGHWWWHGDATSSLGKFPTVLRADLYAVAALAGAAVVVSGNC